MDETEVYDANPYESFSKAYWLLQWAGCSKLLHPRNSFTKSCHHFYQQLVIFFNIVYIIQHSINIYQIWGDIGKVADAVILTISEVYLFFKVTALYFGADRLDKLTELMNDKIFGAQNKHDDCMIRKNTRTMHLIWRIAMTGLFIISLTWIGDRIFKRMQDETEKVPSYMPFEQDTWPKFLVAHFLDTVAVVLWIGYGHFTVDCLIATYYAQARLQLKMINYNLEHLFDGYPNDTGFGKQFQYIDAVDKTVQDRFVFYIKKYEKVCWFTSEVTSIFNLAISVQFYAVAFGTCLAVYQTSSADILSLQFVFSMLYYTLNQTQIFMFCYFGGMVEDESSKMPDAIYLSQWTLVSPRFRKQIIIAMSRWLKPISPRVANVVPLSQSTFVTITRSAYTLYTVLKTRNNN